MPAANAMNRPPHIVLAYDHEWEGHGGSSLTDDPAVEIQGEEVVATLARLIVELGYPHPEVLTTRQLGCLALSSILGLFDGVINIASGLTDRFRYGQTPMLLECLRLPYSGNDPEGMLLCRNKRRTKTLASALGLGVPRGLFLDHSTGLRPLANLRSDMYPLFLKPNSRSTSLGIRENIAHTPAEAARLARDLLENYPEGVIAEEFVDGEEVTVLVLGHDPKLLSIVLEAASPSHGAVLDHPSKLAQTIEWRLAAENVGPKVAKTCAVCAETFVREFKLRDFNRVDFRIPRGSDEPLMLECNGQPVLQQSCSYIQAANTLCFRDDHGVQREYLCRSLDRMGLS